MISLRHTALGLALSLAFAGQALAVTTIPFWHSMEGELGKEVDSLAQRFNAANPDYKIVPVYKGNYEQSLSAGIADREAESRRDEVRLRQRLAGLDPD